MDLETIRLWLSDNIGWIILIVIIGSIMIYNKIKKRNKEIASKQSDPPLPPDEQPRKEYVISPFDSPVMEREYEKTNGLHIDKLSFLRKRREEIVEAIEKNKVLFVDAKKRYKKLEIIGESLMNEIEVLEQDKERYDIEIMRVG